MQSVFVTITKLIASKNYLCKEVTLEVFCNKFGRDGIWVSAIASQQLPRDSGESIFAARQQDVSQGSVGVNGGRDGNSWACKRKGTRISETFGTFFV